MAAKKQSRAGQRPPENGMGLTRKIDETDGKTRQSDWQRPSETASRKTKGAGPALGRHSKDASE